jgi:hypothetical protein
MKKTYNSYTRQWTTLWVPVSITCGFFNETGGTVAQLIEALRYKLEGRGFDSR